MLWRLGVNTVVLNSTSMVYWCHQISSQSLGLFLYAKHIRHVYSYVLWGTHQLLGVRSRGHWMSFVCGTWWWQMKRCRGSTLQILSCSSAYCGAHAKQTNWYARDSHFVIPFFVFNGSSKCTRIFQCYSSFPAIVIRFLLLIPWYSALSSWWSRLLLDFEAILFIVNYTIGRSATRLICSATTHLSGCFCSWTFSWNIGLNILHSESLMSCHV